MGGLAPHALISYTEMEYDYAVTQKNPVMAFVHGDVAAIPVGKTDQSDRHEKVLRRFVTRFVNV